MQQPQRFSLRARARSFRYAFQGISTLIRSEHNARIHLVATILVIAAGFIFSITPMQWVAVVLCISAVFSLEAVNSAVEALADLVSPDYHPLVKKAKDVASAAVLIAAMASVVVAAIIFIPYIL